MHLLRPTSRSTLQKYSHLGTQTTHYYSLFVMAKCQNRTVDSLNAINHFSKIGSL